MEISIEYIDKGLVDVNQYFLRVFIGSLFFSFNVVEVISKVRFIFGYLDLFQGENQ